MNVRAYNPFLRAPCGALRRRLQTLFPQEIYGLVHDAVGGRQGLLAIHNPSPGFLAEVLDHCWGNLHGTFPSTCATQRGGSLETLTQPQGPLQMRWRPLPQIRQHWTPPRLRPAGNSIRARTWGPPQTPQSRRETWIAAHASLQ